MSEAKRSCELYEPCALCDTFAPTYGSSGGLSVPSDSHVVSSAIPAFCGTG